MFKKIRNIKINYKQYGKGEDVVLLHGWGQNIEMMKPLGDNLADHYRITIIDLPGFGLSKEPVYALSIFEYADIVYELLKELKIDNPIMMGHSFGGKISLAYATKYKTDKVVSLAGPYRIAAKKKNLKTKILKSLKKVPGLNKLEAFAKKHIGSTDYKNASEMMRKVLVQHLNLDLTNDLKSLKSPTLLIWGTEDSAVPYEDAVALEKIIPNCGLVTYEGCTHYAYLERLNQTVSVLKVFLGDDNK